MTRLHQTLSGLVLLLPAALSVVQVSQFFPYGTANRDAQVPVADDNFVQFDITGGNRYNFFSTPYTRLFVNNNGGISFNSGVSSYTPDCGPLSVPMILPYWADVDTRFYGGSVFYRESTSATDLAKARTEVLRAFPGLATTINLSWMFIATWDRVPFFGASQGNCSSPNIKNTFQTILVTDGAQSFAMFFYNDINWTTGVASGGNCQGLGGVPAKAGFDTGDGTNYYSISGSCTSSVLGITNTSNVNQEGKWIFRVDQANIVPPPTTTSSPITTTVTTIRPNTTTTSRPNNTTECDASSCIRVGHCRSYTYCDHMTRRWDNEICSEGLYWNPLSGYVLRGATGSNSTNSSIALQCTGSCDLWNNLPPQTQNSYLADPGCVTDCYFESMGECAPRYRYHPQGSVRGDVKVVDCPFDTRPEGGNRQLVWVQERESCDFCYNARRANGVACCANYSGGSNGTMTTTMRPTNSTGFVPATASTMRTTTWAAPAPGGSPILTTG